MNKGAAGRDVNFKNAINYFQATTEYKTLWTCFPDDLDKLMSTSFCKGLHNVNNPQYILKFDKPKYLPARCINTIMFAPYASPDCVNFKYQSEQIGTVFFPNSTVLPNPFFTTTGGWDVAVAINLLNTNVQTR